MKVKVSKSQVLNAVAIAGGVATTIYAYTSSPVVHLPSWLAWVPAVATVVAGLSRSLLPQLSGVPGQQSGVLPDASESTRQSLS